MPNYDCSLTQVGSLSQSREGMLNFYWLSGIQFQSSMMSHFDWRMTQAASPYAYAAVASLEACERRLGAVYFPGWGEKCCDLLKGQGRSSHHGIEREEEWGHEPSSDTSRAAVGSHHPLVRPHAVPGV